MNATTPQKLLKIGDYVGHVEPDDTPAAVPIPQRWYILRTEPNRESTVMAHLIGRRISAYLPIFIKSIRVGGYDGRAHQRRVTRPMFPGYVFVPDCEAETRVARIRSAPGALSFLHIGDMPATFSRDEMEIIMRQEIFLRKPPKERQALRQGQAVKISDGGPFDGLLGCIEQLRGHERALVLIDLVRHAMRLEVPTAKLEAVQGA